MIAGIVKVASNVVSGNPVTEGLISATLAGVASGALAASSAGIVGIIAGNTAISMVESSMNQYAESGNVNIVETVYDGAVGGVIGAVGGKGTGTTQLMDLGKQTVKRVVNKIEYQGINAGVTEFKKATSYYIKSTRSYYKKNYSFLEIRNDFFWTSLNSTLTSDFMKGQFVHHFGRR